MGATSSTTKSHNDQPALFTHGHSKATAFLSHKATAHKQALHLGLAVTHHVRGKQMECGDLIKDPHCRDDWLRSATNELGNLAQGVDNRVKGTNTIFSSTNTKCQKAGQSPSPALSVQSDQQKKSKKKPRSQCVATSSPTVHKRDNHEIRERMKIIFTSKVLDDKQMSQVQM